MSKLLISVLQDPLVYLWKVTRMKLSHFGIELQKFYLDQRYIVQELIYGRWDVFCSN